MEAASTDGPVALQEQIDALVAAVRESQHVLEHVCRYHDDWLDEELRETVLTASQEVEPLWDEVITGYLNTNYEEQLRAAGLLGAQGESKVKGIRKWSKEFFRKPSRRLFAKVAKWMNIVLGSLAAVVPAGEALNEFKQVVEAAVEEERSGKDA